MGTVFPSARVTVVWFLGFRRVKMACGSHAAILLKRDWSMTLTDAPVSTSALMRKPPTCMCR